MQHILDISDVVYPKLTDIPKELLESQKFIDNVTYSTIQASISLDIPWLCIDQAFGIYFQALGFKLYNPYNLFFKLGQNLDFKSKKLGLYLHSFNCIPYVTTLNEFYLLAKSKDDLSYIYLVKMINKYPNAIADNLEGHIEFLSRVLSDFIYNGYVSGEFVVREPNLEFKMYTPFHFGVEDVFYACCNSILQYPNTMLSEDRIALFIKDLVKKNIYSKHILVWIKLASLYYISGHFLNFSRIIEKLNDGKTNEESNN